MAKKASLCFPKYINVSALMSLFHIRFYTFLYTNLYNVISVFCAFISACAVEGCQEMRGGRDTDTKQCSRLESNRKCLNHSIWRAFEPLGK